MSVLDRWAKRPPRLFTNARLMDHRRRSLAIRYCFTAWLSLARWFLLVAALACLGIARFREDPSFLIPAAICGVTFLVTLAVFMIEAGRVRCLMCGAGLLRSLRCEKHPTAQRLFGSVALRSTVALARFPTKMHCPYCGGHYRLAGKGRKDRVKPGGKRRQTRPVSEMPYRSAKR